VMGFSIIIFQWQLANGSWQFGMAVPQFSKPRGTDSVVGPNWQSSCRAIAIQRHSAHINYTRFVCSYLRPVAAEIRILLNAMQCRLPSEAQRRNLRKQWGFERETHIFFFQFCKWPHCACDQAWAVKLTSQLASHSPQM